MEIENDGMMRMMRMMRMMKNEKEKADVLWQRLGLPGEVMPDLIFQAFVMRLYSENSKQGDRKTAERYVELFNETLQMFGFVLN